MKRFLLLMGVTLAMIAVACGSDESDPVTSDPVTSDPVTSDAVTDNDAGEPAEPEESAEPVEEDAVGEDPVEGDFPVTIESSAGSFTLEQAPQRIVSLNAEATEMLFAIGAGEQVVAVDSFSSYPPEAPLTDLSAFDPNIEAITAYEPDLVILVFDANDLVAGLTELGIPVLVSPAPQDIESGYDVMAQLGVATGRVDGTAEAIATLRSEIDAALAAAPGSAVRIYHELDDTYFSASSFGFVGAVYAALGATNIADAADVDQTGFPQLTEEYIVEADPELMVITDLVGYTPEDVAARPGWGEISAVVSDRIVVVNADVASRFGPRLPEFISTVAEALASIESVS